MRTGMTALYARVSSDQKTKDRTIESQIETLKDYAKSRRESIEPDLHFIDEGVSGACLERPGLDKLRDAAFRGIVDRVYVLSPDRLSRKHAHQILLVDELKKLGVTILFSNRDIGETPEDQMLLQIQGVVAEYEREKIMERSRRGKLHAAKSGKVSVLGGAPFGYYYERVSENCDASYIIHAKEAAIVREAFTLYVVEGLSIGEIARRFTNNEYQTKTGRTFWERSVIWGMLRNPAYKGQAAFRKTKVVKRNRKTKLALESKSPKITEYSSSRDRNEQDRIYIPVPAIVNESTFEAAQERLKRNQKLSKRNNSKYQYLVGGIIRCSTCNYSMYGKPTSNSKYKRTYYRCCGQDGHRWANGRICNGHPVRTETVDDLVWEQVKELISNPGLISDEYSQRLKGAKDSSTTISKKKSQLKKLDQEKERIIDLYQDELIEKEELKPRISTIRSKSKKLAQEIEFLENQEAEQRGFLTIVANFREFSDKIKVRLGDVKFEERKQLVRLLVEEVKVDTIKEEIQVKHIIPTSKKYPLCSGRDFAFGIKHLPQLRTGQMVRRNGEATPPR